MLSEGSALRVQVQSLTTTEVAYNPIKHLTGKHQLGALLTEALLSSDAISASATRRHERRGDQIPRRHFVDPGTNFQHDASTLVAAQHRKGTRLPGLLAQHRREHKVTSHKVLFRVAQPSGFPLDQDFAWSRGENLDFLDRPLLTNVPQNGTQTLHVFILRDREVIQILPILISTSDLILVFLEAYPLPVETLRRRWQQRDSPAQTRREGSSTYGAHDLGFVRFSGPAGRMVRASHDAGLRR